MTPRIPIPRLLPLLLVLLATRTLRSDDTPARDSDRTIIARSEVSPGNPARLQQALSKARAGTPVTIAVIGGSITEGAAASQPGTRYGNLIADWWRRQFPSTPIQFVNAGIGATGSDFGALRARRDLLSHQPDLVVVEYAVNDGNSQASAETLEGLVRQLLKQPNQPAVVLLFTMNRGGNNAQEWHSKVGSHYGLPMVSFRDALWPEIQAGRLKWEDVEADQVHPNDRGHAYCAAFVVAALEAAQQGKPAATTLDAIPPVPAPLFSDLFEHATVFEADALTPLTNQGWTLDTKAKAWTCATPGSVIEFEVAGRVLITMHEVVKGPRGKVRVSVDGDSGRELDGWFDQTWGSYRQTNEIARRDAAGPHRVRFELLEDKSPESPGHEFRLLGLGAAGTTTP